MPLDDEETAPPEKRKLETTLEMLRQMSNGDQPPAARDRETQGHLHDHLSRLRGLADVMRSHKVVTAVSITCTSAGVLAVLKILSDYFE